MTASALPGPTRDHQIRPLVWRLPLIAFLVIGFLCLQYLDRLLQREYRTGAVTQAVQTDELLESFIRHRVALLHSLQVLMAEADSRAEAQERFSVFAPEVGASAPDVLFIYYLDSAGVIRDLYPRTEESRGLLGVNQADLPGWSTTLERARTAWRLSVSPSVHFREGGRGMLVYDPIVTGGQVTGHIGAVFAFRKLFNDALAGQLQGRFAYQVEDSQGNVLARSPEWPAVAAGHVRRSVALPDDQHWLLDVAIPRFQPITARVITWSVGILLLLLVILLVMREEARAERLAAHSLHLESLSHDLLDANVRLEERAQQVAEANRAKSRFLANVSHELRTPLNAIVGYNSLALEGLYGELPAALRDAHARIHAAGEHLLGLVNDVLDLAKIEVGRMEVEIEPVDLTALLDSVVTVVEPIASAKGVRVDVVPGRDLPRLLTDARHLRQIVLNLASNAVKFTEKGSVTLVARRDEAAADERVLIVVQDTGIGIAEQDLERIFEEFEQVRPGGRGDSLERGSGLGLTISRKLARLLGGDVLVESRIGGGSRFTLTLPVNPPVSLPDTAEHPRPRPTPATSGRPSSGPSAPPPAASSPASGSSSARSAPADRAADSVSGEHSPVAPHAAFAGDVAPDRRLDEGGSGG